MDRLDLSAVVYVPHEDVYEFLLNFPNYARYSKYLKDVRPHGDGKSGTQYDMHFAWWKIGYTVRSEVVEATPHERIDWEIVNELEAQGAWTVEPAPEKLPEDGDAETATEVHFVVEFDPDSLDEGSMDLPMFVSLEWVVDKAKPLIWKEARRIIARVVRDLEGQSRDVDLVIHERPSYL